MKVIVTGNTGMIGKAVVESLEKRGIQAVGANSSNCDLTNPFQTYSFFEKHFDAFGLIHLAGFNGNIGFNLKHPTEIFYKTSLFALNALHSAEKLGINRIITSISSCAYPDLEGEMSEHDFWDGLPNSTVDCHGLSKRVLDAYGMQLTKKGFKYTSCIINNSFGPYDSIDLNKTKVVTAMIVRFLKAIKNGDSHIVCWGSGKPKREFIYSKDAAEALVSCLLLKDPPKRINISSGHEISIKDLAEKIKTLTGFTGDIKWDLDKPDGQDQKKLSLNLMNSLIKIDITDFDKSLKETIEWVDSQL